MADWYKTLTKFFYTCVKRTHINISKWSYFYVKLASRCRQLQLVTTILIHFCLPRCNSYVNLLCNFTQFRPRLNNAHFCEVHTFAKLLTRKSRKFVQPPFKNIVMEYYPNSYLLVVPSCFVPESSLFSLVSFLANSFFTQFRSLPEKEISNTTGELQCYIQ